MTSARPTDQIRPPWPFGAFHRLDDSWNEKNQQQQDYGNNEDDKKLPPRILSTIGCRTQERRRMIAHQFACG